MSMSPHYTVALSHCEDGSYQSNFVGNDAISRFEKWCVRSDAKWAHLFDVTTGVRLASWSRQDGLSTAVAQDQATA